MTLPRTRHVAAAGVVAALLAALSACAGGRVTGLNPNDTSKNISMAWQPQHAGGTLLVDSSSGYGTMDPQISYTNQTFQIEEILFDGLLAFKKVNGAQSTTIVPDLATALPTVTDGGRTFTFTLRRGIKFSSGQDLTVNDVIASFRRIFKSSGPTSGTFYQYIKGADACLNKPATCVLPGVTGDPVTNRITISLTQPDSEFEQQLSLPFAAIVPASTPGSDQGIKPIPGTGPYTMVSYDPNTGLKLVRNPWYRIWSQDAQPRGYPDVIQFRFGLTVEAEVTEVENGQADWMLETAMPADRLNEIGTKYPSQVHLNPQAAFWYAPMNVNIAPFSNLKARQAVQWAVDKSAMVDLFGGSNMATPACTILPPSYPEHQSFCDYTKGGGPVWKQADLARARELVKESGTAGQPVAVVAANDSTNLAVGQYLQSVLSQIGYKATLKPLSGSIQFNYIQNTKNKVQISITQWYQDYPAASDFIHVLLSCDSFHPGSDNSINIDGYCDKGYDVRIHQAMADELTDPAKARTEWGELDRQAMAQAVMVPLFNPRNLDFVSSRVGHYVFSIQFFAIIDQMWVR